MSRDVYVPVLQEVVCGELKYGYGQGISARLMSQLTFKISFSLEQTQLEVVLVKSHVSDV